MSNGPCFGTIIATNARIAAERISTNDMRLFLSVSFFMYGILFDFNDHLIVSFSVWPASLPYTLALY